MSRRSSTGCQWVKKDLGPLFLTHGRCYIGSKTLSIILCTVSRRAIGSFGTEAILSTEACETRRFAKEVVSSSS